MQDDCEHAPETLPSPFINTLPPETKRKYEEMYQALSCRPPVRRNWTPLVYAAAVALFGGTIVAIVAVLA